MVFDSCNFYVGFFRELELRDFNLLLDLGEIEDSSQVFSPLFERDEFECLPIV